MEVRGPTSPWRRPGRRRLDRMDRATSLRYFYRRYEDALGSQLAEDTAASWPTHLLLAKALPAEDLCGGCASTGPSGVALPHHRCARLRGRALAPCSTTSWCASMSVKADGAATPASSPTCRPPARPGPRRSTTTATVRASTPPSRGLRRLGRRTSPLLDAAGSPVAGEPRRELAAIAPLPGLAGRAGQGVGALPGCRSPRPASSLRRLGSVIR